AVCCLEAARLARHDYLQEGGLVGEAVCRGEDGEVGPGLQGLGGRDRHLDAGYASRGRGDRCPRSAEREIARLGGQRLGVREAQAELTLVCRVVDDDLYRGVRPLVDDDGAVPADAGVEA